jgi:hypothetical protein
VSGAEGVAYRRRSARGGRAALRPRGHAAHAGPVGVCCVRRALTPLPTRPCAGRRRRTTRRSCSACWASNSQRTRRRRRRSRTPRVRARRAAPAGASGCQHARWLAWSRPACRRLLCDMVPCTWSLAVKYSHTALVVLAAPFCVSRGRHQAACLHLRRPVAELAHAHGCTLSCIARYARAIDLRAQQPCLGRT